MNIFKTLKNKLAFVSSLIFWIATGSLTVILFIVEALLLLLIFPFDKKRKLLHSQCFWWANAVIGLNPYWNIKVEGLDNIDKNKAYVVVANHQSFADIVLMYKTYMQFKWVAKESLFKVPFIGWCLWLTKHIGLSRGNHGSIKKVYRKASYWLKNDMSVLFFPEGTRSDTGKMNKFQNGAFKLAIQEKKPILPISINGTKDAIPKGSWRFKTRVNGRLTVLPPIETKDLKLGDYTLLRDNTFKDLESLTA
ncbi:MAG: lysophospholipid acyltransferase family protein [Candidatus Omnitrophota bacterium]